ncbi:uncharacterized protein LOC143843942 [Paroedura picta]|uniref:uncharacterized protein LOC143843942 n=1 Tax=Paroedura picta TaxID=143630 RepID=UPI0040570A80
MASRFNLTGLIARKEPADRLTLWVTKKGGRNPWRPGAFKSSNPLETLTEAFQEWCNTRKLGGGSKDCYATWGMFVALQDSVAQIAELQHALEEKDALVKEQVAQLTDRLEQREAQLADLLEQREAHIIHLSEMEDMRTERLSARVEKAHQLQTVQELESQLQATRQRAEVAEAHILELEAELVKIKGAAQFLGENSVAKHAQVSHEACHRKMQQLEKQLEFQRAQVAIIHTETLPLLPSESLPEEINPKMFIEPQGENSAPFHPVLVTTPADRTERQEIQKLLPIAGQLRESGSLEFPTNQDSKNLNIQANSGLHSQYRIKRENRFNQNHPNFNRNRDNRSLQPPNGWSKQKPGERSKPQNGFPSNNFPPNTLKPKYFQNRNSAHQQRNKRISNRTFLWRELRNTGADMSQYHDQPTSVLMFGFVKAIREKRNRDRCELQKTSPIEISSQSPKDWQKEIEKFKTLTQKQDLEIKDLDKKNKEFQGELLNVKTHLQNVLDFQSHTDNKLKRKYSRSSNPASPLVFKEEEIFSVPPSQSQEGNPASEPVQSSKIQVDNHCFNREEFVARLLASLKLTDFQLFSQLPQIVPVPLS